MRAHVYFPATEPSASLDGLLVIINIQQYICTHLEWCLAYFSLVISKIFHFVTVYKNTCNKRVWQRILQVLCLLWMWEQQI